MKAILGFFCLFTFCFVACKGTPSSPTSLEKYFSGEWTGSCYEVGDLAIREALSINKGLFKRFIYIFKDDSSTASNDKFCKSENMVTILEYHGSDLTIDKVGESSYEASTKLSSIKVSWSTAEKVYVENNEVLNHFIAFKTEFVNSSQNKKSFSMTYDPNFRDFRGYTLNIKKEEYKTFRDSVIAKMKEDEGKYKDIFAPEILFSLLQVSQSYFKFKYDKATGQLHFPLPLKEDSSGSSWEERIEESSKLGQTKETSLDFTKNEVFLTRDQN